MQKCVAPVSAMLRNCRSARPAVGEPLLLGHDTLDGLIEATIPAGRYGKPEEFGAVVAFLASEPAAYVTGEQIRCDGGLVRSY